MTVANSKHPKTDSTPNAPRPRPRPISQPSWPTAVAALPCYRPAAANFAPTQDQTQPCFPTTDRAQKQRPRATEDPMHPDRQCTARRRDGQRCTNPAMIGSTTCRMHGGAAPQVRRAARLRLLELVDPAISTMAKIMDNTEASEQARLRAAENILDRAGYPRQVQVDSDSAKDLLMVRLLELRAQALAERDQVVEQAREIVEGQVVDAEGGADGQDQDQEDDDDRR